MHRTRRSLLLAAGASLALAGCTDDSSGGDGGEQTTDSDGDGVPDRSDYAPRDPDVQSENDVKVGGSDDSSDGGGGESSDGGGGDSSGGGTGDSAGDGSTGEVSYPSYSGSQTITARDNYWAWEFSVAERFLLQYTVRNMRDENYDFDVLLYDPESFREYRAIATEQEEGIRPNYLDGSAPGTESGVRASVELPAGTYYLVVDNTDLSDAGDWGTEDTRQVSIRAETRAP